MKEDKYHTTLMQQFLLLSPMILRYTILFGIYFYYFGFTVPSSLYYWLFAFVLITDILPTVVLHCQYLKKNSKCLFYFDSQTFLFCFKQKEFEKKFSSNDILELQYHVSYGRGTGFYSFERYRYYKIILIDKTEIIITCLMKNKIENNFQQFLNKSHEKKLHFVVFINWFSNSRNAKQST